MTTGKALNGKPYAGNPHVRFDEGEVASAATPRRESLLYKRGIMFAAIAAAIVASAMAANADTVTTNGVTWTYTVNNAENKTVTLGGLSGFNVNQTPTDDIRAMPVATEIDASLIPWTFTSNDTTYTVTAIGSQAFRGCTGLTGTLNFPSAVTTLGRACFDSTKVCIGTLGGISHIYGYVFQKASEQSFPDISDVTSIEGGAFYGSLFTGVVKVRKGTSCGSWRAFSHCGGLEAILALGPDTVASGTQSYTSFSMDEFADYGTKMKVIFMGPNTKGSALTAGDALNRVTGCKMFVPANGFWDGLVTGGTNNEIIYYGATTNIDFTVDDDAKIVITRPVTESALVKALEVAPLFKTHFGWDMKVDTTNAIEVTAGTLTPGMFANAGVKAGSLMLNFAVKTQAQLDAILAAVPSDAMIGIDPTGLTENMVVTGRENVFVKNVPGVEVRRRSNGFAILVL